MPRFAVLHHDINLPARVPHFDLMLENEGILWTWELPRLPTLTDSVIARRIADHRLVYLNYEGPISQERGSVRRIDQGELQILAATSELIVAKVEGQLLRGCLALQRCADPDPDFTETCPPEIYWSVAVSTMEAIRKIGPWGENT
jgi:hypothetical protein